MSQLQWRARVAFGLCLAAVPAGIAAHLALTDIFHGEGNLRLEWSVLQVCALVIAAAVLTSLWTLRDVLALVREQPSLNRAV